MRTHHTALALLALGGLTAAQGPVARDAVQLDAAATGALSGVSIDGDDELLVAGYFDGGSTGSQFVNVVASSDGGVTWGAPVRADRDASGAQKLMSRNSVRVAGSNVYVVWRDARSSSSTDDLGFNYSTDGGQSFQAIDTILDDGATGANEVFDWRLEVIPDPTGDDVYVLFTAEVVGGNTNEEVYLVSSLDGGATWSNAVFVGGDDLGGSDCDQLALAVEGTTVHMAWEEDLGSGSFDEVFYQRTDDAGATLLPAAIRLSSSTPTGVADAASSSDTGLALAVEQGLVLAAWPSELADPTNEEVRAAVSIDGGTSWGTDFLVGGYTAGVDDVDALAALVADGNLVVAWDDNRNALGFDELYAAVSTDQGATFTETLVSGPLGGSVPRIAGEGENVVLSYTSEDGSLDYAAAVYSVDAGASWGAEVRASDNAASDADSTDCGFALGDENALLVFLNDANGSNNVYASGFSLCDDGEATPRNAGSNPASLTAEVPVLGDTWDASVDLSTTGHAFAGVVGYLTPADVTLGGGQVVLVNPLDPSGELLGLALQGGQPATFSLLLPNDPGFCGVTLSVQAIHVGSVTPFALSNAVDLAVAGL